MPKKNLFQVIALLASLLFVAAVAAGTKADQPELDCEALSISLLPEPEGYAEQCLGGMKTRSATGVEYFGPSDTAYIFQLTNVVPRPRGVFTHIISNFSGQTQISSDPSNSYWGWDFNANANTLFAHQSNTNTLGRINLNNGLFTPIGPSVPPGGKTFTGLAIDPMTNEAFATGSDTSGPTPVSTLYSVNLSSGTLTTIGNTGAHVMIDLSINCQGEIYGHDLVNDAIYTLSRSNGAATQVGSTGLVANFAQGMDFDNESGTLYIYAYTGGGTNTYGVVNLNTGWVTPLFEDNPLGEYEGATQTTCGGPPPPGDEKVGLPVVMSNYCQGFKGPWEVEPNDTAAEANGSLCYYRNYLGSANEDGNGLINDYFHFDKAAGHAVSIDVTNFLPVAQVQLFYYTNTSTPVAYIGDQSDGHYHLEYNGPAGKYYIRLVSAEPQAQTYTLRIS